MKKSVEFETYKDYTDGYYINEMTRKEPSIGNHLNYRKFKVKIELIEESSTVLIERLEKLKASTERWNERILIESEIQKIRKQCTKRS